MLLRPLPDSRSPQARLFPGCPPRVRAPVACAWGLGCHPPLLHSACALRRSSEHCSHLCTRALPRSQSSCGQAGANGVLCHTSHRPPLTH
eukprot:173049-Chlamydomonas_euryale.AAC.1